MFVNNSKKNSISKDTKIVSKQLEYSFIVLLLILTFAVRIVTSDAPALDRTMWKEIDYISISKNYLDNGFDFASPQISWPAEPPRTTAMELPLIPFIAAILYKIFGFNVYTVRILTAFAFLIIVLYTYRIARRELGQSIAMISGAFAALFPLYHFFDNILFSEPWVIVFSVMSIYHLIIWSDTGSRKHFFIALPAFSLAVALKLTPLYLLLPLGWIWFRADKTKRRPFKYIVLFVLAALILPLIWYIRAYYLTVNSIDVFGIFGGHNKMQTLTMLTSPNWYRTMADRIGSGILGGVIGSFFALIGLVSLIWRRRGGLIIAYLLAIAAYFVIVAEGQIDAPYRQLTAIPPLAIFAGVGVESTSQIIVRGIKGISTKLRSSQLKNISVSSFMARIVVLSLALIALTVTAWTNRGSILFRDPTDPAHPNRWEFSKEIRKHTSESALLVTTGTYTIHKGGNDLSPVLYYYSDRKGWTLEKGEWSLSLVEDLKERGATHFAAYKMSREPESADFINTMKNAYTILYENTENEHLLIELSDAKKN